MGGDALGTACDLEAFSLWSVRGYLTQKLRGPGWVQNVIRFRIHRVLKGVPGPWCVFGARGGRRWKVMGFGEGRWPCLGVPLPGSRCCMDRRRNERVFMRTKGSLCKTAQERWGWSWGGLFLPGLRDDGATLMTSPFVTCLRRSSEAMLTLLAFALEAQRDTKPSRWWHHLFPALTYCYAVSPEARFSNGCCPWKWQKTPCS